MNPEREYHDVANIFPLMTSDEFQEICDDIKKNGLLSPIVLIGGKILDGRNRYLACRHVGVEPTYVTYTGDSPIEYVLSANLKRRSLTVGQKAMIAEKALPLFKAEAERRRRGSWAKPGEKVGSKVTDNCPSPMKPAENAKTGESTDLAGKSAGVSGKSVQRARKLRETASPEVVSAVESGDMSLNEAVEVSKETDGNGKPPANREKLIRSFDDAISKAVRIGTKIGFGDASGKKAYQLLDQLCRLVSTWK